MVVDEAIVHAREVAAEKRKQAADYRTYSAEDGNVWNDNIEECEECAKDHEQLADWLESLKQYEAIEKHLVDMFGSPISLKSVVDDLELTLKEPDRPNVIMKEEREKLINNRYLYRAKHMHILLGNEHLGGSWVVGFLSGEHYITNDSGEYLVDPRTICQCTGFGDKNGKLIFENDIVFDNETKYVYKIIWNQQRMCWNSEDADGYKDVFEECWRKDIEVKGNIFDNLGLLRRWRRKG